MPITYEPAADLLGHTAPLEHRALFPVLGVPIELQSNSPEVLDAAERALGQWQALAPELIDPAPARVARVVVHPGSVPYWPREPFAHRSHSGWLLATNSSCMLAAQMDRGEALAFVTPELVADEAHFRYNVLESMALALASRHDRVPVHAGAVVYAGRAVLLAGQSTAGKSTLCYACVRDGFELLAEDVIYVSMARGLRLWGHSRHIHLLPDAPRHFPELASVPALVQANGKLKLAVDLAAQGPGRLRHTADAAAVCLLERHAGAASAIEPVDARELARALCANREPGFDLFANTRDAAEALVRGGAYRMHVGTDLAGAVALLRTLE